MAAFVSAVSSADRAEARMRLRNCCPCSFFMTVV
jgi:hypothetical protein